MVSSCAILCCSAVGPVGLAGFWVGAGILCELGGGLDMSDLVCLVDAFESVDVSWLDAVGYTSGSL